MTHPVELISAYADDELSADDRARVARHLAECTECARELALIHTMGDAMHEIRGSARGAGTWSKVHRRITQPVGWILLVAGITVWAMLALVEWFRGGALTPQWLASTAIGIGVALLVVGIGYEQYEEWRGSAYKDVHK